MDPVHTTVVGPANRTGAGESSLSCDRRPNERAYLNADNRLAGLVDDDTRNRRVPPQKDAKTTNLLAVEEHERLRIAARTAAAVRPVQVPWLDRCNDETPLR